MSLTLSDILAANDLQVEAVECPEWGGSVYVRSLPASAIDRLNKDDLQSVLRFVAMTLCDERGVPLAPTDSQIQALENRSAVVVARIYNAALRLNSLSEEVVDDAKKN